MTLSTERLLDGVGWKLLALLQEDARRSYSELGRAVGLSAPAVAERVRRLEEAGIITGYHAAVDPQRVGFAILALIRLSGVTDQAPRVSAMIAETPEVLECHRVTGSDSYVLKVVAASIPHLESLIDRLLPFGEVTTSLVLSTPVARRVIRPPDR
ncbi:MAG TPA: Lrp/AsnC family transcriptional regulator [Roseiflexaceae bacterium]|nr:Lrp/AsnC family transcriptional regulator [Roseiflexaceae bacterium]